MANTSANTASHRTPVFVDHSTRRENGKLTIVFRGDGSADEEGYVERVAHPRPRRIYYVQCGGCKLVHALHGRHCARDAADQPVQEPFDYKVVDLGPCGKMQYSTDSVRHEGVFGWRCETMVRFGPARRTDDRTALRFDGRGVCIDEGSLRLQDNIRNEVVKNDLLRQIKLIENLLGCGSLGS